MHTDIVWFKQLGIDQVEQVGGKNASLGEMIGRLSQLGVRVPDGCATTAAAYREFLAQDGLAERIQAALAELDIDDVTRLAETGTRIRNWILAADLSPQLESDLRSAYADFVDKFRRDPRAAKALLRVGQGQRDTSLDVVEHAATTMVASTFPTL